MIPVSIISAASSGGACSSVFLIASITCSNGAEIASLISSLVTVIFSGRPVSRFLPLISIVGSFSSVLNAEPIFVLTSSAVRSPISRLYFFLM